MPRQAAVVMLRSPRSLSPRYCDHLRAHRWFRPGTRQGVLEHLVVSLPQLVRSASGAAASLSPPNAILRAGAPVERYAWDYPPRIRNHWPPAATPFVRQACTALAAIDLVLIRGVSRPAPDN